jgi:hypothetical protein
MGPQEVSVSGSAILAEVERFKKDPYVWGAAGPSSFDCSGLVQYALTQLGMSNVPRTSEAQWAWVTKIQKNQLQPGDLVFAQFPGDNSPPGHVGVYMGSGEVFSAQDPQLGLGASSLASWGNAVYGYGRVPDVTATPGVAGDTSGDASAASLWTWITDPLKLTYSGVAGTGDALMTIGKDFAGIAKFFEILVQPGTWIRVGACLAGIMMFLGGMWVLRMQMQEDHTGGGRIPVPVPV